MPGLNINMDAVVAEVTSARTAPYEDCDCPECQSARARSLLPVNHQLDSWQCAGCAIMVPGSQAGTTLPDGDAVCDACIDAYYRSCGYCDALHHINDSSQANRRSGRYEPIRICPNCARSVFRLCHTCNRRYPREQVSPNPYDGMSACRHCIDEEFTRCCNCNEWMMTCDAHLDDYDDPYCERCQHGGNGDIQYWAYRPTLTYYRLPHEDRRKTLYLGFELEMEAIEGSRYDAANLVNGHDFLFSKQDGSLTDEGFEMVSHPLSWAWYKEKGDRMMRTLCRDLIRLGMRSHDTRTCGIHVHLTKSLFKTLHLYKFEKLVYENRQLTRRVARRLDSQWATLGESKSDLIKKAKDKFSPHRYVAVNITGATVELRIFKGTLRYSTFRSCLEYAHAAYIFTQDAGISEVTAPNFKAWVADNVSEYPNLAKRLRVHHATIETDASEANGV